MYNTRYTISATASVHTREGIYVQIYVQYMYSLLYYVLKYIRTNSYSGRMWFMFKLKKHSNASAYFYTDPPISDQLDHYILIDKTEIPTGAMLTTRH
jgi:hypothetical protein